MEHFEKDDPEDVRKNTKVMTDLEDAAKPLSEETKSEDLALTKFTDGTDGLLLCETPEEQVPSYTSVEEHSFTLETLRNAEQFREALKLYHNSTKNPNIRALNLSGQGSWQEVMRLATEAETKYLDKGKGFWRKTTRGFSANAETGVPYLKFFNPNLEYVSILFGGLELVLQASAQIGDRRREVLEALVRIPEAILRTENAIKVFPNDPELYKKAEKLYLHALAAIEGTISWLEQGSIKKQFRALLLGPVYGRSFKEKIKAVNQACDALSHQVSHLSSLTIVKTDEKVGYIASDIRKIGLAGETINATNQQMLYEVHSIRDNLKASTDNQIKIEQVCLTDLGNVKEELNKLLHRVVEDATKAAEWKKQTDEGLKSLKEEKDQDLRTIRQDRELDMKASRQRHKDLQRLQRQVMLLQQAAIRLSPEDLMETLDVTAGMQKVDLDRVLRACDSTLLTDSPIAMSLLSGASFDAWYSPNASTQWFIEGGLMTRTSRRHTPLSLMCSKLIEDLHNKEPAVPIFFFCGSHTAPQDPTVGPIGMIKSLIAQVLQIYPVELNFIPSQRYRVQLESGHIDTLCDCFRKLVRQLPMDTILMCIIDGISYFERRDWAADCRHIISELQDLVHDDEMDPRIKLLVTCPYRSRVVADLFPDECRLFLGDAGAANGVTNGGGGSRTKMTDREFTQAQSRRPRASESEIGRTLRSRNPPGHLSDDSSDSWYGSDEERGINS